uniref:Uncharacterized protein n=1 Tax=Castor canadensis TaxID=51338 RepID=A0A8C0WNN1_CASCN
MENSLFPLNSISAIWLNPSTTTWAMDMILAFVCGLGIFLLLIPYLQRKPPSPPAGKKKNPRKVRNSQIITHEQTTGRKACRDEADSSLQGEPIC